MKQRSICVIVGKARKLVRGGRSSTFLPIVPAFTEYQTAVPLRRAICMMTVFLRVHDKSDARASETCWRLQRQLS